jgi:hypothetical protein
MEEGKQRTRGGGRQGSTVKLTKVGRVAVCGDGLHLHPTGPNSSRISLGNKTVRQEQLYLNNREKDPITKILKPFL